tara:strand:- start:2807 stop:3034 length:228 start_codon:yes stop_codon:yes gene_type:complete
MDTANKINRLKKETGINVILPKDIENQLADLEMNIEDLKKQLKNPLTKDKGLVYFEDLYKALGLISLINNFKIQQ